MCEVRGVGGVVIPVYIDLDKSRCTMGFERQSSSLVKMLDEQLPAAGFFLRRTDRTIFAPGWKPIVQVTSPSENQYRLRWNSSEPLVAQLRNTNVETAFQNLVKDPAARASWV